MKSAGQFYKPSIKESKVICYSFTHEKPDKCIVEEYRTQGLILTR